MPASAACDVYTHTNAVFVAEALTTDFQISDLYYGDNTGALQVTLTQLLSP